ncbi:MAG: TlpA family protein disulfide reductase [Bacteroidales bacterium]|nr:TlpA family protein disulfide reductase [Bacteroidales bacterium]
MIKKHLIGLWVFILFTTSWAQTNIRIHGTAANGDGRTIELYHYTDQFSHQEELLDKSVLSNSQEFELKCFARYPMLVFLQVENYSQSFYVEPGRDYEVVIPQFDWNIDEQQNIHLAPIALPVEFLQLPNDDINILINRFDLIVDSFITANRTAFDIKFHPQKQYYDKLVKLVDKQLPDTENEFFNRYKRYQLATLKYNLQFDTKRNIYNQYIKSQPILYFDENYMTLFTTLFANHVSLGNKYIFPHQMVRWIEQGNLSMMVDSMGVDPLLRNEQLRELVILQALTEAYFNGRAYNPEKVKDMIELLAQNTKFGDHRVLAQAILKQYSTNEKGSEAPTFELPDADKNMVDLASFQGKWIYLSFIRVTDPNSIGEIETIAHFKDSILAKNPNVEFITISCDREFQKMYHFLKNTRKGSHYNWTWLHFNNDFDLLRHYQVVSFPTFILIDPQGRLPYSVTPSPSSGFLISPPWVEKTLDEDQQFFLRQ